MRVIKVSPLPGQRSLFQPELRMGTEKQVIIKSGILFRDLQADGKAPDIRRGFPPLQFSGAGRIREGMDPVEIIRDLSSPLHERFIIILRQPAAGAVVGYDQIALQIILYPVRIKTMGQLMADDLPEFRKFFLRGHIRPKGGFRHKTCKDEELVKVPVVKSIGLAAGDFPAQVIAPLALLPGFSGERKIMLQIADSESGDGIQIGGMGIDFKIGGIDQFIRSQNTEAHILKFLFRSPFSLPGEPVLSLQDLPESFPDFLRHLRQVRADSRVREIGHVSVFFRYAHQFSRTERLSPVARVQFLYKGFLRCFFSRIL